MNGYINLPIFPMFLSGFLGLTPRRLRSSLSSGTSGLSLTDKQERARRVLAQAKRGNRGSLDEEDSTKRRKGMGTSAARIETHVALRNEDEESEELAMGLGFERALPDKLSVERQMQISSPLPRSLIHLIAKTPFKKIHGLDGDTKEVEE
jgi:hypothetical protein